MTDHYSLDKCKTYIDCHLHAPKTTVYPADGVIRPPAVTISRQTGAGGLSVAERLAENLQQSPLRTSCPWTVFDKNLVSKVLEDHHLPERLAQFMPEDKVGFVSDALEELLGLHPPSWNLLHQTTETILKLAELGNVILVGRSANVITSRMNHVLHIRLVGSLARRAERVRARHRISQVAALDFIKKEDAGRSRYLRKHFHRDVEDPLLYHLTINTDWASESDAVDMIAGALIAKYAPRGMVKSGSEG